METNIIPETPPSTQGSTPLTTGTSTPIQIATPTEADGPYANPPTTIPVTVQTSPEPTSITRFANVNAAAGLTDPFALLVYTEKDGTSSAIITHERLLANNSDRAAQKLAKGALLVEAGNFAAVACWEPPIYTAHMEADDGDLSFPALSQRPIIRSFFSEAALWRRKALHGRPYWHLTLMARDPQRRDVKGAVRSVLEAGIWWAQRDHLPIWLEAGNERARDIYAAFGFKEVGVTYHGLKGAEVPIWMMIWEPSEPPHTEDIFGAVQAKYSRSQLLHKGAR